MPIKNAQPLVTLGISGQLSPEQSGGSLQRATSGRSPARRPSSGTTRSGPTMGTAGAPRGLIHALGSLHGIPKIGGGGGRGTRTPIKDGTVASSIRALGGGACQISMLSFVQLLRGHWDARVLGPGVVPGICMWATARLIETVGCENVHLDCAATDVAYVEKQYLDGGVDLAPAKKCLQEKCPAQSLPIQRLSDATLPRLRTSAAASAPGSLALGCAAFAALALLAAAVLRSRSQNPSAALEDVE